MAESEFRALVQAVHAQLETILTAEGRAVPELVLERKVWNDAIDPSPPRICWIEMGGRFARTANPVVPATLTEPIAPQPTFLGAREALAGIKIWHTSEEHATRVLDRLWMAADRTYPDRFMWDAAGTEYEFRSQVVGPGMRHGVEVVTVKVPIWIPVAKNYDGEFEIVTVEGHQLRVGIANPPDEADATVEFDLNRWSG